MGAKGETNGGIENVDNRINLRQAIPMEKRRCKDGSMNSVRATRKPTTSLLGIFVKLEGDLVRYQQLAFLADRDPPPSPPI